MACSGCGRSHLRFRDGEKLGVEKDDPPKLVWMKKLDE
jgi:hypothetical protein